MAGLGKWLTIAVIAVLVVGGGAVVTQGGGLGQSEQSEYDRTEVTLTDFRTGDDLATVDVRIADTRDKRYTGLSDTESLGENEGMLFIHDSEGQYSYVMRDMAFPIDIVFIDSDGAITKIHHAEADSDARFSGTGKYVLELPYEYTTENDITERDRVQIPNQYR